MEREIDEIKQMINNLSIKYQIRFMVFKTTDTKNANGKIIGNIVEAEFIY